MFGLTNRAHTFSIRDIFLSLKVAFYCIFSNKNMLGGRLNFHSIAVDTMRYSPSRSCTSNQYRAKGRH